MLFTSLHFVIFFTIVYAIYIALRRNVRAQNLELVIASYTFYGYWDYRFCFLLLSTTLLNFLVGRQIGLLTDEKKRKVWCAFGVTCSLAMLGFFKYFNFFESTFLATIGALGMRVDSWTLKLLLPVGMSFYTFKEISYVVDIYRKKLEPEKFFPHFALYVSFFPQLVAGPIERAGEMLPSIRQPRQVTAQAIDEGVYLILWGLFKKLFIADNLSLLVGGVFNDYQHHGGLDLFLALFAYAFQIYGDFSGYTDIARGLARLMGFHLPLNFKLPYFASNPSEFWQRWHITLSQWLRDYLYIPLGGNRKGSFRTSFNLLVTMLLGGLWHGAAWNFVLWGAYHGAIQVIHHRWVSGRPKDAPAPPAWLAGLSIAGMFFLTLIGWLFFRAHTTDQIVYFLTHLGPSTTSGTKEMALLVAAYTLPLIVVQVLQQRSGNLLILMKLRGVARLALYLVLFVLIVLFGQRSGGEFIYFQF